MIGILEQWDDTLALFEAQLPTVYRNVQRIWRSAKVQAIRNSTKSVHTKKMNAESKKFLINGPLKWDYELYTFGRSVFNNRLVEFGLVEPDDDDESRHIPVFNATLALEESDEDMNNEANQISRAELRRIQMEQKLAELQQLQGLMESGQLAAMQGEDSFTLPTLASG